MSFLAGFAGQAIFACVTQGVGAVISGVQGANSAYDQDRYICSDYNTTIDAITTITGLTATINEQTAQAMATNETFMKLNDVIRTEKSAILSRQKTFQFKVYVTIVVNIILTLIVMYNILY